MRNRFEFSDWMTVILITCQLYLKHLGVDSPVCKVTWEVRVSSSCTPPHLTFLRAQRQCYLTTQTHPPPFLSLDCSNNLLAGSNGLITSHIMMRAVSEPAPGHRISAEILINRRTAGVRHTSPSINPL